MEKPKKHFLKNISYSFSANVISLLLGIVATLVFPKFIDVIPYGYYQLYIFYTGYVIITSLGLSDGVQLKIAGRDYSELDVREHSSLLWFMTLTQTVLYIGLFFAALFFVRDPDKRFVFMMVCLVGIITHPRYYMKVVLQATDRLKKYSHIEITERSISILCSIIAILCGCRNYVLLVLLDVIGRFISFFIATWYCRDIVFCRPSWNRSFFCSVWRYTLSGAMILFAMQTGSIVVGVTRFGIERHFGIETFGKLSVAIALSNMVLRCVNSISVVMFPTLRNVKRERLAGLYHSLNTILMTFIFICLIFFKPLCFIVGKWLPAYAVTLNYAVLLLPICVFECKYSLLINTNLKNLNREKWIGIINAISVVVSIATAAVSVFVLENIEIALLGVLLSISLRSLIGEHLVGKDLGISITRNCLLELFVSALYIATNYYLGGWWQLVFIAFVAVFVLVERKKLLSAFRTARNDLA